MNIVADENIPFVKEAFADLGSVRTLPGRSMQNGDLTDCDCLLVRSVTKVNQALLIDTPVKFVASATIGTDHIDLNYLKRQNIGFANAPGCNAESAAEYVLDVLFYLAQEIGFDPFKLKAGIIGYGNVGSRVQKKLEALGIQTLVNDPPKQQAGDRSIDYVSLRTILKECNLITLHVPLNTEGEHATRYLLDRQQLAELSPGCILFNAARGPVINNSALSSLLEQRDDLTVFLDTWENEPAIDTRLLSQVDFGSPHIAGYSYEGKLRGTQMILDAACSFFQAGSSWSMQQHLPQARLISVQNSKDQSQQLNQLLQELYPVQQDYQNLLDSLRPNNKNHAQAFDLLRKNYPKRFEYDRYLIESGKFPKSVNSILKNLGFNLA